MIDSFSDLGIIQSALHVGHQSTPPTNQILSEFAKRLTLSPGL